MANERIARGSAGQRVKEPDKRLTWLLFSGILLLYLLLSFYQLNLPGLHYDEAFEGVPALQLLRGQPVSTFRQSGLVINGQIFPLMTQDYIGALNTYAVVPFIAWLGPTPAALRAMSILVGLITLSLTGLLTAQLFGNRWPGLAAMLLLAVDPTFIFWNRQGVFVTAITATIGVAAAWCWLRRFQGRVIGWTLAGAFLLGLGLYAKLLFIWLIAALVGAVMLLNLPWLFKRPAPPKITSSLVKETLLAGLVFLLGCWPLLLYNWQTGGTWLSVSQNAGTSYYGVNNLAFGPNLLERAGQFISLVDGSHLWYLGQIINNPLPALALGIILVWAIGLAWTRRPKNIAAAMIRPFPAVISPAQAILFPFLVIGLVIIASIGTVSALWVTHFALLMPWPAIALAGGGWQIARWTGRPGRRFNPSRFILITGLSLLVITNLVSVIRYHQALTQSGGLSTHSDAIYDLSDWLAQHAGQPVAAMDWGLTAPVIYLTNGRVTPTELFGYAWESDADLTARLQQAIAQPATLYLWRAPDEIIFDRSPQFKALYRPLNLEETIEAAFYEQSGRPLLGVTRLVAKGSAANPPQ